MYVLLAHHPTSAYNLSIWRGHLGALQAVDGVKCFALPWDQLPHPKDLQPKPDVLWVVHGSGVMPAQVKLYKDYGITTVVQLLDEPYELNRSLAWSSHYDWVLCNDRITVKEHNRQSRCVFSPLAYDPAEFSPEGLKLNSEILVLMSPLAIRKEMLADVLSEFGERITWVGPGWRTWTPRGNHVTDLVTPEECAKFYRGAKVVVNIHRDSAWSHFGAFNPERLVATHMNPRCWEASACGALQLCTPREDLTTYAPAMPVFNTGKELAKLLRFYLTDDTARERRAERVYEQIKPHTYGNRIQRFLEQLVPA